MLRIELRLLRSLRDQRSDRVVQRDRTQARQIFDLKFEPARRADAAYGRRIEAERYGLGIWRSRARTSATILDPTGRAPRSSQGFKFANSTAVFDLGRACQEIEAGDGADHIDAGGGLGGCSELSCATSSVRCSDAPSGNWMTGKK